MLLTSADPILADRPAETVATSCDENKKLFTEILAALKPGGKASIDSGTCGVPCSTESPLISGFLIVISPAHNKIFAWWTMLIREEIYNFGGKRKRQNSLLSKTSEGFAIGCSRVGYGIGPATATKLATR